MTKWEELTPDESFLDSTTQALTLRDINNNDLVRFSVPTLGQLVVPVHKITDIPLVNGFRQLEQDKVYNFLAEISSSETLLVPAGWNGYIVGMHNPLTKYEYTGTGIAIQTALKIGDIDLAADAGGGLTVFVTPVPHGLLNGQYVNITNTTSYNGQALLISNVTAETFDIQIPFVSSQSGNFDTGYNTVNIMNMAFTGAVTAGNWAVIDGATTSSVFRYNHIKASGFQFAGDFVGGQIIGYDGDFEFTDGGWIFFNINKAIISATTLTHTQSEVTGAKLLTLSGSPIKDIILNNMQFNVSASNQFPLSIGSEITGPVYITNSLDNNLATNYFDTGGGTLDQTDDKVFTFNNGVRANSSTGSESRSVGVLEVDGSAGGAVPIVDITPVSGDFTLDSTSQGFSLNTSTGIVTYNGLASKIVIISYSIEAAQEGGAVQDLIIDVRINGVQQAKTIRTMTTMGVGDFVSIASIGGLFTINPGDTFQLFTENTSNTNNTDFQNTALLIR